MSEIAVRDYPWQELPRARRAALGVIAALRSELGADAAGALARWGAAGARPLAARLVAARVLSVEEGPRGVAAVALRGPDGVRASLAFDHRTLGAVLGLLSGAEPQAVVAAGALERGLCIYAVASFLSELGAACAWSVEVEEPQGEAGSVLVEAELELGASRGLAWLGLDASSLAKLRARAYPTPAALERTTRLAGVRLRCAVELGRLSLATRELASLGPGDLLVSPECPREADSHPCLLRVGAGGFPGLATVGAAGSLRIEEPYRRGGLGMTSEGAKRGELADDLPVELTIELGRLSLSAAQVLALEPGDVLALNRPLRAAVELRVGDRPVARGELCDVEGEAGVRLLEVY